MNFITYQEFVNKEEASDVLQLLEENNIEFIFEKDSTSFDPTLLNNSMSKFFSLKIRQEDFKRLDQLFYLSLEESLANVEEDYYLFDFSDEELFDVLSKSDEWSKFDFFLARKILNDRGANLDNHSVEKLKENRLEELAQPESHPKIWIILGYVFAVLGGFFALIIGWHLFSHKKTLPDGSRVSAYTESDRKHGVNIFLIGLVIFLILVVLRVYSEISEASSF